MENWKENKDLVKAYEVIFQKAYLKNNFDDFIEFMRDDIGDAVIKFACYTFSLWDHMFSIIDQIMADAQNHYKELQCRDIKRS